MTKKFNLLSLRKKKFSPKSTIIKRYKKHNESCVCYLIVITKEIKGIWGVLWNLVTRSIKETCEYDVSKSLN